MKNSDIAFELVDFKQTPVDRAKIDAWLNHTTIDKLFNTRGTTYRTLKLKELNLDDTEKAAWLSKENMLIKRPVIEYKGKVMVGFNQEVYENFFL